MGRLLDSTSPISRQPLSPEEVVAGSPSAGARVLATIGEVEVGVWEMSAGVATDIEVDEVFVVLEGEASITFEGGSTIEVRPGCVVLLEAGEHTTWSVREKLRKVYLA